MKILFTGGGTLGPVTPLLAVAEELNAECRMQKAECELVWIGTRKGPERELVKAAGIKYQWIFAPKWRRYFDVRNLIMPLALHLATKIAWFKLLKMRPDVIVTAGGFVGVPVVWAAWWLRIFGVRIPCVLHNQDVRWSLANRLVAPFVKRITYALPGTVPVQWKKKAVWTGNPVRRFILQRTVLRGVTEDRPRDIPTILVIGGGTGARRLNEIVEDALPELTKQYNVIHLTGRGKGITPSPPPLSSPIKGEEAGDSPPLVGGVRGGGHYRAFEFVTHEIADLYAAADLVITRAGMGVLSELAVLGKPLIIVPIPGSHQEDNARYFEKRGAAVVLNQNTLDGAKLNDAVRGLLADEPRIHSLATHAKELMKPDAAKRVAQEVIEIAKK